MCPDDPCGFSCDPLFEVELRVARRADELARTQGPGTASPECWLRAEREVFGEPVAASSDHSAAAPAVRADAPA
jgi:hypothetical protein